VALQRDDALGLHRLGQQKQQAEQVLIVLRLPLRPLEHLGEPAARRLDGGHRIGNEERRDACAEDAHQLVRQGFQHHGDLAAGDDEAAEHHDEQEHDADDLKQDLAPRRRRLRRDGRR
jgi:hypothetical protein